MSFNLLNLPANMAVKRRERNASVPSVHRTPAVAFL